MNKTQILRALESMKVGENSIQLTDKYVAIRLSRKIWRLAELLGDAIMSGSAEEVAERAVL